MTDLGLYIYCVHTRVGGKNGAKWLDSLMKRKVQSEKCRVSSEHFCAERDSAVHVPLQCAP